jgi:hypothetical protein
MTFKSAKKDQLNSINFIVIARINGINPSSQNNLKKLQKSRIDRKKEACGSSQTLKKLISK